MLKRGANLQAGNLKAENIKVKCPVHIIESPSPSDFFDDTREGPLLVNGLKLIGIPPIYHLAINREMLIRAINEVAWSDNSLGPPILHLSMHGNKKGILLSDGSHVKWEELRRYLTPVNKRMSNLLVLCLSSCRGFYGFKMAWRPTDGPPFRVIIGSTEEILPSDLAIGFMNFYYQYLFKSKDEDVAIEAMQVSAGNAFFFRISASEVEITNAMVQQRVH